MRTLGAALLLCVTACGDRTPVAPKTDAYWLWAGVAAQPVLDDARTLYLLEAEITAADPARLQRRRSATPRIAHADVWIVYRTDTLAWGGNILPAIHRDIARWRRSGNRVVGVQLDFDARTRGLADYAAFLRGVRAQLPADLRLGITGLLDWSANGDPQALKQLAGTVDEVVLQTYQGRHVIPGYERYLARMDSFPIPFRIGIAQGEPWRAPPGLEAQPAFRGYVVFLLNPPGARGATLSP